MTTTAAALAVAAAASVDATAPAEGEKPKHAECISAAREETIRDLFRKLRHEVTQGCGEVGKNLLFPEKGGLDRDQLKSMLNQARILVNQAEDHRWGTYSADIVKAILGTVEAYQAKARTTKAQLDTLRENTPEDMRAFLPAFPSKVKVPFTALVSAWPLGTDGKAKDAGEILVELDRLVREGKIPTAALVNGAPKGQKETKPEDFYVHVDFQATVKAPKVQDAANDAEAANADRENAIDNAPKSGEAPKSRAA